MSTEFLAMQRMTRSVHTSGMQVTPQRRAPCQNVHGSRTEIGLRRDIDHSIMTRMGPEQGSVKSQWIRRVGVEDVHLLQVFPQRVARREGLRRRLVLPRLGKTDFDLLDVKVTFQLLYELLSELLVARVGEWEEVCWVDNSLR